MSAAFIAVFKTIILSSEFWSEKFSIIERAREVNIPSEWKCLDISVSKIISMMNFLSNVCSDFVKVRNTLAAVF